MLRQIIEIARNIGLKEMQLSCERDNIPSVKTITKNREYIKEALIIMEI